MKLNGVKVLDLTQFMPGSVLTGMMADHGAEVIKIESPGGDPTRQHEHRDDPDLAAATVGFFASCNRGKYSLSLDLKHIAAKEILYSLVKDADVLVESFRPGVAERLGMDYETLRQRNPRLTYCSLSAFGQTGPLRDTPAHDSVVQAFGGSLPLADDATPVTDCLPTAALAGALNGLVAILMALLSARSNGRGERIDIAMRDCLLPAQPFRSRTGDPAENQSLAMCSAYRTSDGLWLCLGGRERVFCENLLRPLGRADLIEAATGATSGDQGPVHAFLAEVFSKQPRTYWLPWLETRGISAAPVLDLRDALRHPQTQARQMLLVDNQGREHIGTPLKFQEEPGTPNLRVPRLGEDNATILAALGYREQEIAALRRAGVIHSH
ncbi:CaiB/BaiF CoA transferase family protein [Pseudomonas sp. TE3911]